MVQSYLDSGVLARVEGASEFSYPVFLVCARTPAGASQDAVRILRDIVREESDWSQRWDFPQ
ncbi:hypothetical protein D3C72_1971530 [compost metagenome]